MARIDRELTVNASLERVFDYVKDPLNWPEIWPSLMKVEDVEQLPNGGYRGKYEYKMAGMHFKGIGEMTEFIPYKWIVAKTRGAVQSTITITYRSIENKTRITLTMEYEVPIPLLGKLAEFIILKMNEQEADLVIANIQTRFLVDY